MKNLSELIRIFLIIFLAFSFIQCSSDKQEAPALGQITSGPAGENFTYIVLLVDTENIEKGTEEEFAAFANQPTDVSDQDFETGVITGDSIVWVAYSYSNPVRDSVIITKINGPDLNKILEKNDISGKKGKGKGRVKPNAIKDTVKKYKLHFDVYRDGHQIKNLKIDPKLRVLK